MNEEQQRMMAEIIVRFILGGDWTIPYNAWGVNVGQCRYCGAVGEMKYPDIFYEHNEKCPIALCDRLNQSLQTKEESKS